MPSAVRVPPLPTLRVPNDTEVPLVPPLSRPAVRTAPAGTVSVPATVRSKPVPASSSSVVPAATVSVPPACTVVRLVVALAATVTVCPLPMLMMDCRPALGAKGTVVQVALSSEPSQVLTSAQLPVAALR